MKKNRIYSITLAKVAIIYFALLEDSAIGLKTKSCNHDQIYNHIKNFFNCMYAMKDEKIAATIKATTNETTEWCNLLTKETTCFTWSLGSCLDQQITEDLETLYLYQSLRAEEISCNKIGNRNVTNINSEGSRLMTAYFTDIQKLNEIVSFDRNCKTLDLVSSMLKIGSIVKREAKQLREIIDTYFRDVFFNNKEDAEIKSLPVCKTAVAIADNCFKGDKCFSNDEMNLAKSVTMTFYKLQMALTKDFNGTAKVKANKMEKINQVFIKLALEDYQKLECQRNLTRYTMMVDLPRNDQNKVDISTETTTHLQSSTPPNSLKINATMDSSTPKSSNNLLENKPVLMGILISGALFVVAIIIVVKLYLDGTCIRLRASGLLPSSSNGYRYNGRYSLY